MHIWYLIIDLLTVNPIKLNVIPDIILPCYLQESVDGLLINWNNLHCLHMQCSLVFL